MLFGHTPVWLFTLSADGKRGVELGGQGVDPYIGDRAANCPLHLMPVDASVFSSPGQLIAIAMPEGARIFQIEGCNPCGQTGYGFFR